MMTAFLALTLVQPWAPPDIQHWPGRVTWLYDRPELWDQTGRNVERFVGAKLDDPRSSVYVLPVHLFTRWTLDGVTVPKERLVPLLPLRAVFVWDTLPGRVMLLEVRCRTRYSSGSTESHP